MSQPLSIESLRAPSPERSAFIDTISEALDECMERDIQTLVVSMGYARVHPNGVQDPPQLSRKADFPVSGADPGQIVDHIVSTYADRAPGDGFVGRIQVRLEGGDGEHIQTLGVYERYVQIGDVNYQRGHEDEYGRGGHLPPPAAPPNYGGGMPSHFGPDPGGYGGPPHGGPPTFGPDPGMDEMSQEQQGMQLAQRAADERRLDLLMRKIGFLVEQNANTNSYFLQQNQHFLQFCSYWMNQYSPPVQGGGGGGGAPDNGMATMLAGLISMVMGGGGKEPSAPKSPMAPAPPLPTPMAPAQDSYIPYEPPPMEGEFAPDDITEDMANEWAQNNPDAARRVAKSLLPPAMQNLIPE